LATGSRLNYNRFMNTLLIAIVILFIISTVSGAVIWFLFSRKPSVSVKPVEQTKPDEKIGFKINYSILPLVILLFTIILVVFFYGKLPVEIAYHFDSEGIPDSWLSRSSVIYWAILPQLFLTVTAVLITLGLSKISGFFTQLESTGVKLKSILNFMGNIIALPQVILCFAMADIFSYNVYEIRLIPVWLFALIVMGLGAVILGVFFIRTIRQVWGAS